MQVSRQLCSSAAAYRKQTWEARDGIKAKPRKSIGKSSPSREGTLGPDKRTRRLSIGYRLP
jgi:hypothetical protein